MKRLFLLLLALSSPAWGQGVLFTAQALTTVQVNGVPVLAAQPFAEVSVCQLSSGGCETTTVYSDQAMSQPLSQPFKTDALGNLVFWAPAANYQYTFCPISSHDCYTYAISGGAAAMCTAASCSGVLVSSPIGSQTVTQETGTVFGLNTVSLPGGGFSQPTQLLQNGMTPAMMQAMQGATTASPTTGSVADVTTCGQLIPVTAQAQSNCYSAFQRAFSASNPVGYYSREEPATNGITEWGANYNLNDVDDVTGTTMAGTTEFGLELDANVHSTTTAGAGILFGATMPAQPVDYGAIHVPRPEAYNGNRYSYGFVTDDGSMQYGYALRLGAYNASTTAVGTYGVTASASQSIGFDWFSSLATSGESFINADATGALHLIGTGAAVDTGDFVVSNGNIRDTNPGGLFELGSLTAAGTPAMDFHSSGNDLQDDARIIVSGGTAVPSQGNMTIYAAQVAIPGTLIVGQSTPASSSAACTAGQIWTDATYIYVCTANSVIKRAALSTF